jgi:hypothetical protein
MIQMYARSYLDLQRLRVGVGHRLKKIIELACIKGYCEMKNIDEEEIHKKLREAEKGQRKAIINSIQKELGDKLDGIVKQAESLDIYVKLNNHYNALFKEEKRMLKEAKEEFKDHELWDWCKRTKGLKEVAALSFLGYINPYRIRSASQIYAYLGLVPGAKLKSGEKASYNPKIKGRFVGVIATNVIRQGDEYYRPLFDAKKDYLTNRPDIQAKKGTEKGWKAHIHALARLWLTKLLIGHAVEIIRESEGFSVPRHRGYIPPKPEDPIEMKRQRDIAIARILMGEDGLKLSEEEIEKYIKERKQCL